LKWAEAGYGIAIWRDQPDALSKVMSDVDAPTMVLTGKYPGYARAINALTKEVFIRHPETLACVACGDDTDPCEVHPDIVVAGLIERFGGTFFVAQPTSDRWSDALGPIIDRIAGSPFIGREWCRRAHAGVGPYFPGLTHMGVDDAIKWAAEREGVYVTLPDIGHFHRHFTRTPSGGVSWEGGVPPHLRWCNTPEHWAEFQRTFAEFKRDYDSKWRPLPA
jgi:hypothetical protein